MRFWRFIILLAVLSINNINGQTSFNKAKMDSLLTVYEQKNKLMLTLAISENGNTIYKRATGYSWIREELQTQANTNTKYRIGSISKTFTAVMVLQLIEEKKLKLTTPLSRFYPKFPNSKKITIEHLLMHRSGIHNFTDDPEYVSYMNLPKSQAELMDLFMKLPSDFEPGIKHSYSNTNYVLLGFIIEKLTRQKYQDVLKTSITDKIGLQNTYYGTNASPEKNEARSFIYNGKNWEMISETDMSIPAGAGAIVSTAEDLTHFIESIFNYSLLTKETVDKMIEQKDGYGMGIYNLPFYDKTATGHNGRIDNFESGMFYFRDSKMALAFSANGSNIKLNDFMIGVLSICFNKPYSIPQFYSIDVDENILSEYSGIYFNSTMQLSFYVTKEGNMIIGQAEGQSSFPLDAQSATIFVYNPANIQLEFQRDMENKVHQFLLKQNGMEFIFQKLK